MASQTPHSEEVARLRTERAQVIARLETKREEAKRRRSHVDRGSSPYWNWDGRISGLTTAIEALRGGEDG